MMSSVVQRGVEVSSHLLFWIALAFGAAACSSSGSDEGAGGGITPAETVEDVLDNLRVDTTETPRVDSDGDDLPEDYAPFGSSASIERFAELAVIGFETSVSPGDLFSIIKEVPDANGDLNPELLHRLPPTETTWADSSGLNPVTTRAAVGGDFDADGIEELAIVYHELNDPFVQLIVIDDEADGFARSEPIVVSDANPTRLEIVAGDFNGDSLQEVAVGISLTNGFEVVFLEQGDDGLRGTGDSFIQPKALQSGSQHIAMAVGNADYDLGQELAIVFNERAGSEGRAEFVVLDDVARNRAVLASGPIRGEVDSQVFTAQVGDVSFGNLDEDPLDELVLGGLTNISGSTTSIKSWGYLVVAHDDGKRGFPEQSATQFAPQWPRLQESGQSLRLNYLYVNALDIDGDRIDEIQANQFIFEDFINAPPWTQAYEIPAGEIIWESGNGGRSFSYEDSTLVVADVNSDRREDIVYISEAQNDIRIWALDMVDGFSEVGVIDDSSTIDNPLVIPVNVDNDSIALEYSDGRYQFVFTQPIVIAALAAAPCNPDWGQNIDACRTSYGTAESTTIATEESQTITASASVGYEASFAPLGVEIGSAEAIATFTAEATRVQGSAYSLTQRVEHTTGPIEDGVLFTTIPLDQYTYEIVSHPNPALVGAEVVVSLPREPITVLTTREFYNASITSDDLRIDEQIFEHIPGDPLTYPSTSDRASLLNRFDGFESREVDVGEGGGNVTVGVSVFEETSEGASYSWNVSLDVKTTAGGFITGFGIGYGEGLAVTLSAGSETNYTGTVANLDANNFISNGYSFGLFSYIYEDPSGQAFEVLNYTVTPQANAAP
jgi:hypothetical protein